MTFGNLVNELLTTSNLGYMVSDCGFGISVSQWRNIACHKNYRFLNGNIVCNYGNNLLNEIVLQTKEEILAVTLNIAKLNRILNFATKFFVYDNIDEIGSLYQKKQYKAEGRDETWQLIFITKLLANGFEVLDIRHNEENLTVKIRELTNLDYKMRGIQASKAIYDIWYYSHLNDIIIETIYFTKEDKPYLSARCKSDICDKIGSGEEEIVFLAENTTFTLL